MKKIVTIISCVMIFFGTTDAKNNANKHESSDIISSSTRNYVVNDATKKILTVKKNASKKSNIDRIICTYTFNEGQTVNIKTKTHYCNYHKTPDFNETTARIPGASKNAAKELVVVYNAANPHHITMVTKALDKQPKRCIARENISIPFAIRCVA